MNLDQFYDVEFNEHKKVVDDTFQALRKPFKALVESCVKTIKNGGKIIFFGNGGSAADAQHLATELTIRYKTDRTAIAALALTTDTSALTAACNDIGFDRMFSRQIEALGKPEDLVIGISTSGQSPNVLKAFEMAREIGMTTCGFTGKDGGKMHDLCDILIHVPAFTTSRIQEMHITIGQMLCGALEQSLGYVNEDVA